MLANFLIQLKRHEMRNKAIKVGNVIMMSDKIIAVQINNKKINVVTTVGETILEYKSEDAASQAFDIFCKQL